MALTNLVTATDKPKGDCHRAKVISYSTIFLSLFLFYIISIQSGDSIKCWVCRSDGDPKCADPFDNKSFPITDCKIEKDRKHLGNLKATMCRKVRQKVEGNWRYLRSCAWLGEPGIGSAGGYTPDERYCIHRSGTYNIHVEYCTCRSKDGCNGAKSNRESRALFLILSSILTWATSKYVISTR